MSEAQPETLIRPAEPDDTPAIARIHVAGWRWAYRGQTLREHQRIRGEVHIREVHRDDRAVRVHADGSVWRDDLRIYQVDNIAIRLGAPQPEATEDQR